MTGTKTAKAFVRICGIVACVTAAGGAWDAEAGWRRRCGPARCCEPVCCESVCCEPVCCEPVCCETWTTVSACPSRCTTMYDACGRRIATDCGCAVVHYRIVSPTPACCEVATSVRAEPTATVGPTLAAGQAKPALAVKPVVAQADRQR